MERDTSFSLVPINRILKLLLLTNVHCKDDGFVPTYSLLKSVLLILILAVINILFLIKKFEHFTHSSKYLQFHNCIQMLYWLGYFEYITDLFFIHKSRHCFPKYLDLYKTIDRITRIPDFIAIRATLLRIHIGFLFSFICTCILDNMSWRVGFNWLHILPTLYAVNYFYYFINILTVFDVISQVVQIEYRLRIMVEILKQLCSQISQTEDSRLPDLSINAWIRPALLKDSNHKVVEIHSLSKLYLLLTDQVFYINKMFGVRLVFCMLNQLILMIHLTNVVLRYGLGVNFTANPSYHLPEVSNMLWLFLSAMLQLTLVYRCEQPHKESKKAISIVEHIFINNKKIDPEVKMSLSELRALIKSRPISFHAAGFFTLSYPLLVSIGSVVVTYTIILFQSAQ